MKKKWLISLIVTLAALQTVKAQEEQVALPPNFALAKMPAFSKWQIVFSYEDDKSVAAGSTPGSVKDPLIRPRQVTITRTNPFWQAVMVETNGETQECWGAGSLDFFKPTPESRPIELQYHGADRYGNAPKFDIGGYTRFLCNYSLSDFPDLEWVSPRTYVGGQKGILIFRKGSGNETTTAVIAADTFYPVSWTKDKEIRTFRILSPPTDRITLPADAAKILEEVKHVEALGGYVPPRPPNAVPPLP